MAESPFGHWVRIQITRHLRFHSPMQSLVALAAVFLITSHSAFSMADDSPAWKYSAEQLTPFWSTDVVHRESVLFVRDTQNGEAKASVLFPINKIISVQDSTGSIVYRPGDDFKLSEGSREISVPATSRIVTMTEGDLRRPPGSQKHRLTHRDGNGEILFGATHEYHTMQTWITYSKAKDDWPVMMPSFNATALPKTIARLQDGQPLSIVLLGDSISTGCNASGWAGAAPFQPAYQDLLKQHLAAHYQTNVELTNLAVGGTSTPWGITQISKVVESKPDLIILAFGMNDSAGRSPDEYGSNIAQMISVTRKTLPDVEFILVASMLGNRDWTVPKHDVFPKYCEQLSQLCTPGIALADMTSVWEEFLRRKKDRDLTGNGVNHPNDFGHRVYAQVLSALLIDEAQR